MKGGLRRRRIWLGSFLTALVGLAVVAIGQIESESGMYRVQDEEFHEYATDYSTSTVRKGNSLDITVSRNK